MILTGLAVGAVLGLTPLKTVQPFVIRVDNNTGVTDIVTTLKNEEKSYGEVVDKFWLAQYVRHREGYDWQTVQDTFDATILLR
ncbi:VirB8/TrbF family protein, partial [Kingella kingae]|uniref:VirB8/TrbF family protein n=1 Tax=Kingella kingae TaxID=504 RepID=UPI0005C6A2A0